MKKTQPPFVQCGFVKERGYWRGFRCGNPGKLYLDNKYYCSVHYGMMVQRKANENA